MQINVNGQNYSRWEDVPAEVRQQLAATLPDADKNGVPDLFEGTSARLPTGARRPSPAPRSWSTARRSVGDHLPPEIQQQLQQALGCSAPMFGAATTPPPARHALGRSQRPRTLAARSPAR